MGDLDLLLEVIRCKRDVKIQLVGLVNTVFIMTNILCRHFKFGLRALAELRGGGTMSGLGLTAPSGCRMDAAYTSTCVLEPVIFRLTDQRSDNLLAWRGARRPSVIRPSLAAGSWNLFHNFFSNFVRMFVGPIFPAFVFRFIIESFLAIWQPFFGHFRHLYLKNWSISFEILVLNEPTQWYLPSL